MTASIARDLITRGGDNILPKPILRGVVFAASGLEGFKIWIRVATEFANVV